MNRFLVIAAVSGFLAVALGAFGAHALKNSLNHEMLEVYKTGVQYQFYHTFALLVVSLLMMSNPDNYLVWSGRLFIAGILLFSGSLYVLSISGIKILGAITPIGGVSFLAGWIMLMLHGIKYFKAS